MVTKVCYFIAGLATAGKSFAEKNTVDAVFGDKALEKSSIYFIKNQVKEGANIEDLHHQNPRKPREL
jgi:hypothetical protein